MRVPIRKAGQYTFSKPDPYMTQDKFTELTKNLVKLKEHVQPSLAEEVKRLALMGDFSENAAYQMAKGSLRGINQKIEDIEKQLAIAIIIKPNTENKTVQIGNFVTLEINKQKQIYHILGSSETNPETGVISYQSPLGKALINKKINDIVEIQVADVTVKYKIIKIN